MVDDPLGALGAELVGAARRMALGPTPVGVRRLRSSVGGVAAALAALIVGVGAVVLLGHGGGSGRTGGPSGTTSAEVAAPVPLTLEGRMNALIGTGDVGPAHTRPTQSVSWQLGFRGDSTFTSTAGAVVVSGGVRIELWELAARPSGKPPIDILAAVMGGRVIARARAPRVLGHGLVFVYGYTSAGARVAVVVPNDVVRVRLLVPGARSMLAAVHHNIAAFEVKGSRPVRITGGARVIWYGRKGEVIRRTGA